MSGEHRTSRLPARWLTLEAHDSRSRNLADAVGDDVTRPCKGPTPEKVHLQEWTPPDEGRRSTWQTRSSLHPVRDRSLYSRRVVGIEFAVRFCAKQHQIAAGPTSNASIICRGVRKKTGPALYASRLETGTGVSAD